jgi:uncharacterized membrane protein
MVRDILTARASIVAVEQSIDLEVPVRIAYNQWTQFELLPQFLDGIESVTQVGGSRLHWVGEIDGVRCEWMAFVTRQRPDRSIRWESGSGPRYDGAVTFVPLAEGRSRVTLCLEIDDTGGPDDRGAASGRAERSLARFKVFIEARGAACSEWHGWATTNS